MQWFTLVGVGLDVRDNSDEWEGSYFIHRIYV